MLYITESILSSPFFPRSKAALISVSRNMFIFPYKEFKASVGYLYDSVSDIAMELENIDEAMKIASRAME